MYLEGERLVVVFSDCYGVILCKQASFFCRTMRFFFGESFRPIVVGFLASAMSMPSSADKWRVIVSA